MNQTKKRELKLKLLEFTNKLKEIPEIIGVYYTGSTATEKWDDYSDIDIDIVVEKRNYNKIVKKLPKLLSIWGKAKLINNYKNSDETYAFLNDDYLKVEIDPVKKEDVKKQFCFLKNFKIVHDKTGFLRKKIPKKCRKLKPKISQKEIENLLLDTRANLIYIVRHYARGQKFSGTEEITTVRWDLFHLLSKLKGLESFELIRNAENILTKKEWALWKNSKCKSYKRRELKRAIIANWKFMKYLESLYKGKLNLRCNDKEILSLVLKTLKRC